MSWFAPKLRQTATASATRTILNTASIAAMCAVAFLLSVGQGDTADPTVSPDVEIQGKSFRCIRKMTPVRHFYVDNLRGELGATLAAANPPTGAVYPPGSVIQLVPTEAMVKRRKGFNTATRDWAIAGGASGVTMARAGPHPRRARHSGQRARGTDG